MLTKPTNLHASLKRIIKHFILVLDALGDSEMRFLQQGASWRAVNEASAYGYTEAANVRLCPSAREVSQAEVVASWLAWLGKMEGALAVPRIVNWSHDEPMWRMAAKEKCSERTIANRIDRSVASILKQFGGVESDIESIEEGPDKPVQHFSSPAVSVATGIRQGTFDKVWIDGIGFMKDGRRINSGDDRILRRVM